MRTEQTLIIGASSDIGKAIAKQIIAKDSANLILISRSFADDDQPEYKANSSNVTKIKLKDYQPQSIDQAISQLSQANPSQPKAN